MELGEIIASRVYMGIRDGVELELTALVGKPQAAEPPSTYFMCPYQIIGEVDTLGVKHGRGEDALQALQLALKMLEVDVVALKRNDFKGQLWWEIAPKMGLGLEWPEE